MWRHKVPSGRGTARLGQEGHKDLLQTLVGCGREDEAGTVKAAAAFLGQLLGGGKFLPVGRRFGRVESHFRKEVGPVGNKAAITPDRHAVVLAVVLALVEQSSEIGNHLRVPFFQVRVDWQKAVVRSKTGCSCYTVTEYIRGSAAGEGGVEFGRNITPVHKFHVNLDPGVSLFEGGNQLLVYDIHFGLGVTRKPDFYGTGPPVEAAAVVAAPAAVVAGTAAVVAPPAAAVVADAAAVVADAGAVVALGWLVVVAVLSPQADRRVAIKTKNNNNLKRLSFFCIIYLFVSSNQIAANLFVAGNSKLPLVKLVGTCGS